MIQQLAKRLLASWGINKQSLIESVSNKSIKSALSREHISIVRKLRKIVPDLSDQYSLAFEHYNECIELKMRALHAFQCELMLKALEKEPEHSKIAVVDIGDSAGTHMHYLEILARERLNLDLDAISVIRYNKFRKFK